AAATHEPFYAAAPFVGDPAGSDLSLHRLGASDRRSGGLFASRAARTGCPPRGGARSGMMLSADFVVLASVSYVGLLFLLAWGSDVWARQGRGAFLRSPLVYTLSISVYCTSWTFYGAVGTAAR